MFGSILALGAFATSVCGHTIFQEMYVNGVDQGHINGIRVPTYDGVRPTCTSSCSSQLTALCLISSLSRTSLREIFSTVDYAVVLTVSKERSHL